VKKTIQEMKTFLLLWLTQSFSGLGSAMTGYALVIWSYTQEGSALMTAFLMVSSYAPYVLLSIFAGALSDKWNKKIIIAGDTGTDSVPGGHQPGGIHIQCGVPGHAAFQEWRQREGFGAGERSHRRIYAGGQHPGLFRESTQKPGACHLQLPVVLHEL
jgi:hypothetical protein